MCLIDALAAYRHIQHYHLHYRILHVIYFGGSATRRHYAVPREVHHRPHFPVYRRYRLLPITNALLSCYA